VSKREVLVEPNLFLAFLMMIGGALATGVPIALVIIWVCS
jgi:hypothetical protein